MVKNRKRLIIFAAVALFGLLCGFFVGKGMYDKPIESKIERDTVTLHDTVPDIAPVPKDSARVKYVTRWLPSIPDTITQWDTLKVHDSVAVAVPITSKHYGGKNYDAYVSGFEPNLDSIFVYNETQLITERVTISKPPNKWELDFVGGIDYNTASKDYKPYALGELMYKPNRLQVGVQGGVIKVDNKAEPIVGGKVKIKIF